MIITTLLLLAFFMPLILSKAEWEIKAKNLYTNESGYISTDVEYGIVVYVAENYMGEESHRPLLTIDVIIDEGDPSDYTGLLWYFILYSGSKEDFLNGVATELSKESDIGYWGFAEFEVNESGDYVVSYEIPDFEKSTNYWFNVDVYLDLWWYVWEEETTTTSTTSTTTSTTTTTTINTNSSSTTTTKITSKKFKTITIHSFADSYIDQDKPNSNFGGQDSLHIGYSTQWLTLNNTYKALLAFDITELPDDFTIEEAVLEVHWWWVPETISVSVYQINAFNENTVSWNNAPTFPEAPIDMILVATDDWSSWDVTSAVTKNQKIYLGIFTSTDTEYSSQFDSREDEPFLGVDNRPRLKITYSTPTSEYSPGFALLLVIGAIITITYIRKKIKTMKVVS